MDMLYDKILVAVDGSEPSNRALHEAIKVAKLTGGILTIVHVYPADPSNSVLISASQQFNRYLKDNGKIVLENAQKMIADKCEGVVVEALLLEGDAADQIVETAHNGSYDLIVVGARGINKLSGLILGSVSQGIVKNSPCPVLITK